MYEWLPTVVSGVLMSIVGATWWFYSRIKESKRQDERTAIGYYRKIIDDQNRKIDLHDHQMQDANEAIKGLILRCNTCDLDNEVLWGVLERKHENEGATYDFACNLIDLLNKQGISIPMRPKKPSDLPQRKNRTTELKTAEFAVRTAEQGSSALHELNEKLKSDKDSTMTLKDNHNGPGL